MTGQRTVRTHGSLRRHTSTALKDVRIAVIAAGFHGPLGRALVKGASETLRRGGIRQANLRVIWVPGAFELPAAAARVIRSRPRPHAVVAVGALVKGDTLQYDILAHAVAQGLTHLSVTTGVPVTCGVIVADTLAQARARADGTIGHRGEEAARAALEMVTLFERLV